MTRNLKTLYLLAAALAMTATTPAQTAPPKAPPTHLIVTSGPQLVNCAPVTFAPCMSMGVTAADDQGKPAAFPLPPVARLLPALTLQSDSASELEVKPFYVSSGAGPDAAQHSNVILMMIDISGSMNDPSPGSSSRFLAVRSAVARYLDSMQEGTDEIAIVPFESHSVIPTIRAAVFSSRKADVVAQLNALPQPSPKNNTALYQATFTGIESLRNEITSLERDGRPASELQPHLIVMTDGKNEVLAGDDPQLLNGPLGLQQAATQVVDSHMDVVGVGFGDRTAIDAAALERLSTRFFYAADADQLLAALHVTRSTESHVLTMTWVLPEQNRIALTGRDQVWTPSLALDDGKTVLPGTSAKLTVPATAAPLFSRAASPQELVALIATHPPASSGWSIVLVHLLLLLGVAVLLILLWFWIPRLVWNENFLSAAPPQRWSSNRPPAPAAARSAALPPGFAPEAPANSPIQRSPAQTTQVGPRGEKSRTRLNFD